MNIVARALIVALTWSAIFLTGVGLNWLINATLGVLDAPEFLNTLLSQLVVGYIIISVIAITLVSLGDMWDLTLVSLSGKRPPSDDDVGDRNENA